MMKCMEWIYVRIPGAKASIWVGLHLHLHLHLHRHRHRTGRSTPSAPSGFVVLDQEGATAICICREGAKQIERKKPQCISHVNRESNERKNQRRTTRDGESPSISGLNPFRPPSASPVPGRVPSSVSFLISPSLASSSHRYHHLHPLSLFLSPPPSLPIPLPHLNLSLFVPLSPAAPASALLLRFFPSEPPWSLPSISSLQSLTYRLT